MLVWSTFCLIDRYQMKEKTCITKRNGHTPSLSPSPSLYSILCMSILFWQTPVPHGNKLQTPVPYGNKLHTPVPYGNKLHTPVPYGNKLHTPPTNYHLLSCSTRAKQKRLALNEKKTGNFLEQNSREWTFSIRKQITNKYITSKPTPTG